MAQSLYSLLHKLQTILRKISELQYFCLSLSLSISKRLLHDQSLPCTSSDSRIFENVTAGQGTCEGSEERRDCVKTAQKGDCWYGTGKREG
jgi:hypothetical protein